MTVARTSHTATLLPNDKVLVVGGLGGLATAELYDPSTGQFSATGSMVSAVTRYSYTATLLDNVSSQEYGKVLVVGGTSNGATGVTSAELYDPATGLFSATGSMAAARVLHAATLLGNGKLLVTGGTISTTAELYQ